MKFLLVDPPHKIWEFLRSWVPSPACLQLAAYVEADFDMEFLDCTIQNHPWRDLEARVRELKPEVVGLSTACTYFIYDTMHAARLVKEASPGSLVLVGGAHPSLIPEETLRECRAIDFICVGEGEVTLYEFLSAVEEKSDLSQVKGLAYLDGEGRFVFTGHRPFIEDLDSLPMPAYHLYDMEHPYVGLPSEGKRGFLVNFARGCPHECSFCSESVFWRRTWRSRSPQKIGDEFELLKETYNRKIFYVGDDIFNVSRQRGEGFIGEMCSRKTGQHFWLQSRSDLVVRDEDLMDGFKEAGVYQFMIGIEHSKQGFLDAINKKTTSDINTRAMQILKAHGLMVMATIIIGLWEETEEDRRELMRFLRPYVDHLGMNVVTPYPGTPFFQEMDRLGRIKTKDFSKYDQIQAVMATREEPDLNQITDAHISLMRKYYWQPKEVFKAFFSRNSILRHHHKHFLKIGITAFKHEVFGLPMWQQDTYQKFEDYIKERGYPPRGDLTGP
jgi:anaerobic magnesium-protoporphyrin IX monomethyl ester cyclase